MLRANLLLTVLLLSIFPSAIGSPAEGAGNAPISMDITVEEVIPHDSEAFTQGLVLHDGSLYESTGKTGQSTLRELDPNTGEVLRSVNLSEEEFGEGLAYSDGRLIQLTWLNNSAHIWNLTTFEIEANHTYEGEGWGLCADGEGLWMSNGSSQLTQRSAETFEVTGVLNVTTMEGEPQVFLNELECVGEDIWANIWFSQTIVRINSTSGVIEAVANLSGLLNETELVNADVLNGIAFDGETDEFYVTGKLWPKMFKISMVENTSENGESGNESESTPTGENSQLSRLIPVILFIGVCLFLISRRRVDA